MVTKTGKVIHNKGKYYLEVEGKHQIINEKALSNPAELKNLAGKNVEVTYSTGQKLFPVRITASEAKKPIPLTCYVPPAEMLKDFKVSVHRSVLLDKMFKEKHINQEIYEKAKAIK